MSVSIGQTFPILLLFIACACNSALPNREDRSRVNSDAGVEVLQAQIAEVPVIAANTPYGVWFPDTLSQSELNALLEIRLPKPDAVARDKTFLSVIEEATGKTVIWSRQAASHTYSDLEAYKLRTYQQGFSSQNKQPTLKTAMNNLLALANREGVNTENDPNYMYRNFAIVCRKYIVIMSLPVGRNYLFGK
jgi:hypothetical protein